MQDVQQIVFEAIGTKWVIDIDSVLSSQERKKIGSNIKKRIGEFEQTFSRFIPESFIVKTGNTPGTYTLPPQAKKLFDMYESVYKITNGAFTPLVGSTLSQAGYDSHYTFTKSSYLKKPLSWEEALEYNFPTLVIRQPVTFDFGAAGKGYLIDIIADYLKQSGFVSFTIDGGQDIVHFNKTNSPIRVGLEHPGNPEQVIGMVNIGNESICGSSGNRRKWGEFHHIINPHTLRSPKDIIATWVIAENGLLADALSTCLFFSSPKVFKKYSFDYVILYKDFSVDHSTSFKGELFT